jgi:hypothetical protein
MSKCKHPLFHLGKCDLNEKEIRTRIPDAAVLFHRPPPPSVILPSATGPNSTTASSASTSSSSSSTSSGVSAVGTKTAAATTASSSAAAATKAGGGVSNFIQSNIQKSAQGEKKVTSLAGPASKGSNTGGGVVSNNSANSSKTSGANTGPLAQVSLKRRRIDSDDESEDESEDEESDEDVKKSKKDVKNVFQILVVIDDMADNPKLCRNSQLLNTLYIRGRHTQISTITSVQQLRSLSTIIRVNTIEIYILIA